MQGTYSYVPETNHVSRGYSVAAIYFTCYVSLCWMFNTLHQYFPKHARSVQYGCFLYAAQVFFWMFLKQFQLPLLLAVSFCFYIPQALYFYFKVFIF